MEGKRRSLFRDGSIISLCQASSYTSERRFVSVTGGKPLLSSTSSCIGDTNLKLPECVSYWVLELERSEKGREEDEEEDVCLRYGQTFRLRRWRHASYLALKRVIPGSKTCPVYLSPNPDQTLFRATPRNRVRRDGDLVVEEDDVNAYHVQSQCFLSMASMPMRSHGEDLPFWDLNSSKDKCPWKILFCGMFDESLLYSGDVLAVEHYADRTYRLGTDPDVRTKPYPPLGDLPFHLRSRDVPSRLQGLGPSVNAGLHINPVMIHPLEHATDSSFMSIPNQTWIIESVDEERVERRIQWNSSVRLRHSLTGLYLSMDLDDFERLREREEESEDLLSKSGKKNALLRRMDGFNPLRLFRTGKTDEQKFKEKYGDIEGEKLLSSFSCTLIRGFGYNPGRVFFTNHRLVFVYTFKSGFEEADYSLLQGVEKARHLGFPNAIRFTLPDDNKVLLASFLRRDKAFELVTNAWKDRQMELAFEMAEDVGSFDEIEASEQEKKGGEEKQNEIVAFLRLVSLSGGVGEDDATSNAPDSSIWKCLNALPDHTSQKDIPLGQPLVLRHEKTGYCVGISELISTIPSPFVCICTEDGEYLEVVGEKGDSKATKMTTLDHIPTSARGYFAILPATLSQEDESSGVCAVLRSLFDSRFYAIVETERRIGEHHNRQKELSVRKKGGKGGKSAGDDDGEIEGGDDDMDADGTDDDDSEDEDSDDDESRSPRKMWIVCPNKRPDRILFSSKRKVFPSLAVESGDIDSGTTALTKFGSKQVPSIVVDHMTVRARHAAMKSAGTSLLHAWSMWETLLKPQGGLDDIWRLKLGSLSNTDASMACALELYKIQKILESKPVEDLHTLEIESCLDNISSLLPPGFDVMNFGEFSQSEAFSEPNVPVQLQDTLFHIGAINTLFKALNFLRSNRNIRDLSLRACSHILRIVRALSWGNVPISQWLSKYMEFFFVMLEEDVCLIEVLNLLHGVFIAHKESFLGISDESLLELFQSKLLKDQCGSAFVRLLSALCAPNGTPDIHMQAKIGSLIFHPRLSLVHLAYSEIMIGRKSVPHVQFGQGSHDIKLLCSMQDMQLSLLYNLHLAIIHLYSSLCEGRSDVYQRFVKEKLPLKVALRIFQYDASDFPETSRANFEKLRWAIARMVVSSHIRRPSLSHSGRDVFVFSEDRKEVEEQHAVKFSSKEMKELFVFSCKTIESAANDCSRLDRAPEVLHSEFFIAIIRCLEALAEEREFLPSVDLSVVRLLRNCSVVVKRTVGLLQRADSGISNMACPHFRIIVHISSLLQYVRHISHYDRGFDIWKSFCQNFRILPSKRLVENLIGTVGSLSVGRDVEKSLIESLWSTPREELYRRALLMIYEHHNAWRRTFENLKGSFMVASDLERKIHHRLEECVLHLRDACVDGVNYVIIREWVLKTLDAVLDYKEHASTTNSQDILFAQESMNLLSLHHILVPIFQTMDHEAHPELVRDMLLLMVEFSKENEKNQLTMRSLVTILIKICPLSNEAAMLLEILCSNRTIMTTFSEHQVQLVFHLLQQRTQKTYYPNICKTLCTFDARPHPENQTQLLRFLQNHGEKMIPEYTRGLLERPDGTQRRGSRVQERRHGHRMTLYRPNDDDYSVQVALSFFSMLTGMCLGNEEAQYVCRQWVPFESLLELVETPGCGTVIRSTTAELLHAVYFSESSLSISMNQLRRLKLTIEMINDALEHTIQNMEARDLLMMLSRNDGNVACLTVSHFVPFMKTLLSLLHLALQEDAELADGVEETGIEDSLSRLLGSFGQVADHIRTSAFVPKLFSGGLSSSFGISSDILSSGDEGALLVADEETEEIDDGEDERGVGKEDRALHDQMDLELNVLNEPPATRAGREFWGVWFNPIKEMCHTFENASSFPWKNGLHHREMISGFVQWFSTLEDSLLNFVNVVPNLKATSLSSDRHKKWSEFVADLESHSRPLSEEEDRDMANYYQQIDDEILGKFVDQISIASDMDSPSQGDRRLLFSLLDGMKMVFEDAFTGVDESEDRDQVGAIDLLLSFTLRLKDRLLWKGEDEEETEMEKRKKKVDVLLKKNAPGKICKLLHTQDLRVFVKAAETLQAFAEAGGKSVCSMIEQHFETSSETLEIFHQVFQAGTRMLEGGAVTIIFPQLDGEDTEEAESLVIHSILASLGMITTICKKSAEKTFQNEIAKKRQLVDDVSSEYNVYQDILHLAASLAEKYGLHGNREALSVSHSRLLKESLTTISSLVEGPNIPNQEMFLSSSGGGIELLEQIFQTPFCFENPESVLSIDDLAKLFSSDTGQEQCRILQDALDCMLFVQEGSKQTENITSLNRSPLVLHLLRRLNALAIIHEGCSDGSVSTDRKLVRKRTRCFGIRIAESISYLRLNDASWSTFQQESKTLKPFFKRIGRVEYVKDKNVEVVMFIRDKLSTEHMHANDRDDIIWGVSLRNPSEKIEDFHEKTEDLYHRFRRRDSASKNRWRAAISSRGVAWTVTMFSILVACVINGYIFFTSPESKPGHPILTIMGFVLLFFLLLMNISFWNLDFLVRSASNHHTLHIIHIPLTLFTFVLICFKSKGMNGFASSCVIEGKQTPVTNQLLAL
eukprot:TRINITY_DN1610_c0_g1_i1.p1 TRINITY_DN1610_c0_g1~~TRINITY_DN1610_c0_g1_i1.p1  ORF type:complete len:2613 (-),score=736.29 TRINITY_DN1610_c0_g1_i1:1077-8831(-)